MDEELDNLAQRYALTRRITLGERLGLASMVLSSPPKTMQSQDF
jgi:hypothetical protein